MEGSLTDRERRAHPRLIIDLPLEYRDGDGSCLRGGIVVDASEGGFLIETVRDIPVGTELGVTVLFPNGFELANFKVVAKIVRKKPYQREDWKGVPCREGYQYGLEFIQMSQQDRLKLDLLLNGRYNLEETPTMDEVHTVKEAGF
jgi:hypothetical protein